MEGASLVLPVLLTKKEAADRLRTSVRSLDRLRSAGEISTVKVLNSMRITEVEIAKFINKQTVKTVAEAEGGRDQ
jgi:hypothetical protein